MKINDYINGINDELITSKKVLELYNNVFVFTVENDDIDYGHNSNNEYRVAEICNNIINENFNLYNKNIVFFSDKKTNNEDLKFNYNINKTYNDILYSYESINNYIVFSDFIYITSVIDKTNLLLNFNNFEIPCHYTNTFRNYINEIYEFAASNNCKIIFENLNNQKYWEDYIKTLEIFQ